MEQKRQKTKKRSRKQSKSSKKQRLSAVSDVKKDHNTEIRISTKDIIDRYGLTSDYVPSSDYIPSSDYVPSSDYSPKGWLSTESIPGYGYRFQDLQNVKKLSPFDLFYLSRFLSSDPGTGSVSYDSKNTQYSSLSSYVAKDFLSSMNVGSMAWEDKYSYAKIDHDHGFMYSRDVKITPVENDGDNDPLVKLVQEYTDEDGSKKKDEYVISYPVVKKPKQQPPKLGELKFLASPNIKTWSELGYSGSGTAEDPYVIGEDVQDFWVYPDGSYLRYDERLADAYSQYTTSTNVFKLPDIRDFLKLDPSAVSISHVQYKNSIKPHHHSVEKIEFTGEFELKDVKMDNSSGCTGSSSKTGNNAAHHGGSKAGSQTVEGKIDASSIEYTPHLWCESSGKDEEIYPEHQVVPIMIYIGNQL